jgi:hypothetical protein
VLRFYILLLGAGMVMAAAVCFWEMQGWIKNRPSFLAASLILLLATTSIISRYIFHAAKTSYFVQVYVGTIVIKLLGYGAYCFWMISANQAGAALNIAFFMIVYFVFTALEILFLFRKISGSERPKKS